MSESLIQSMAPRVAVAFKKSVHFLFGYLFTTMCAKWFAFQFPISGAHPESRDFRSLLVNPTSHTPRYLNINPSGNKNIEYVSFDSFVLKNSENKNNNYLYTFIFLIIEILVYTLIFLFLYSILIIKKTYIFEKKKKKIVWLT